jgi:hypothetical protein
VQVAAAHCVPAAYLSQAPAPLQKPLVPQVVAPASVHCASGSWPEGTLVQAPRLPASAHDWQVPVQAELQQYPWAQKPELQVAPAVQVAPTGDFPQLEAVQTFGVTQSVLAPQAVRQEPPAPQLNGEQLEVAPTVQVPVPLQRPAGVIVEPAQVWAEHTVPLG